MPNKIYIVAAEGNMWDHARINGGLYANVGQTTREVSERLHDDDYRRKNSGRRWQVLLSQEVGDSVTDKQIHPLLKSHPGVSWDPDCDNTEQFLFKDDVGDGVIARQIVRGILQQVCLPLLQAELSRLQAAMAKAETELEERAQIIRDLASGEIVQESMRRLEQSDDRIQELKEELTHLNHDFQAATAKNEKLKEELDYVRAIAGKHLERIRGMNDVSKQLQQSEVTREVLELKLELLRAAAIVVLLVVIGIGWWKVSAAQEETRQFEAELGETQAALKIATLKSDRLALKVLDLAAAGNDRGRLPSKAQRQQPPVPLSRLTRAKYDELNEVLGKSEADDYALGVSRVEAERLGDRGFALTHSSPPDMDVDADMENVKVLDSGTLTILINDQVIPAATRCLLNVPDLSGNFSLTSNVGILPDGSVGHLRTLASRGPSPMVEECIVPAIKGVRIEAPGINLLGAYTVEINIKRDLALPPP